jgi:hypothetical protein
MDSLYVRALNASPNLKISRGENDKVQALTLDILSGTLQTLITSHPHNLWLNDLLLPCWGQKQKRLNGEKITLQVIGSPEYVV